MLKYLWKRRSLISLFIMGLLIILAIQVIGLPILQTQKNFPNTDLGLESYDLYDLGVADINLDGRLDIFTTNHSARQTVGLNNSQNHFQNILSESGLSQDRQFPGLEDSLEQPEFTQPGLYIYRYNRILYFHPYQLTQPVSGQLKISWPLQIVEHQTEAETDIQSTPLPSGGTSETLTFRIQPNGMLALKGQDDIVELSHQITLNSALSTQKIFVGHDQTHPPSHQFELMWRDRHSLAWIDLNQDQQIDVFIGRGGVKGQLSQVPDPILDEMMMATNDTFDNQIAEFKFEKKDCPGRQAAWVDYNQDGLLDLYTVCGRG